MGSKCVFAADYKLWKNQRQILAPAFTTKKLKSLKPIVNKAINKLMMKFDDAAKSGHEVDLIDMFREMTLSIIISTALGVEIDHLNDPNNKVMKAVCKFFEVKNITPKHIIHILSLRVAKLFDLYFLNYDSLKYLYQILEKVIDMKKSQKNCQFDFINLMLEAEAEHMGGDQRRSKLSDHIYMMI